MNKRTRRKDKKKYEKKAALVLKLFLPYIRSVLGFESWNTEHLATKKKANITKLSNVPSEC